MKGCEMRSGFYLDSWQKKSLRNFFKMEVSTYNDEMKMAVYGWQDLQEHCEKEMQMLEAAIKEAKVKVNVLIRGYMLYYKELGRICAFKLMFWEKHKGWLQFIDPSESLQRERECEKRMEALKRVTAICEQITLGAKNGE